MDIRSLLKHLEEQMAHSDAREPNCRWIADKLKEYINSKDDIGELVTKARNCEWCNLPRDSFLTVDLNECGKFGVCNECFNLYLFGEYGQLKTRIGQVKG